MTGNYTTQLSVIPNLHQQIQQSSLECYSGASACHPGQSIQIPNWAGIIPGIMKNQDVINLSMLCCKSSIFITHTLTCGGDNKKWAACCITCCIPLIASSILQEQWICYDPSGKMNYG